MHGFLTLALAAWLLTTQVDAPPEAADQPANSIAEQFRALKSQMDQINAELQTRYTAAETEKEKEEVMTEAIELQVKKGTPLADKALSLVADRPKDDSAVEVLTWILQNHSGSNAANGAADLLIEHHLADPQTPRTASRFVYAPMSWTEKLIRALVASDLPRDQKAQAHFQLAQCVKSKASMPPLFATLTPDMQRMMKLRFGDEYLKELTTLDPEAMEKEAVRLFTEVADEYGDANYGTRTMRDYAESAIFEIENLGIGKTAPEITGEDIDGEAMRLSDYRGRVVMLDFWGHW